MNPPDLRDFLRASLSNSRSLLVYIAGSERSGSTLLDLLLANHSCIQSLGEAHFLSLYARENVEPCTCGQPVGQCPFWTQVQLEGQQALGLGPDAPLLQTLDTMLLPRAVWPVGTALQAIALFLGTRRLYNLAGRWVCKAHQQSIHNSLFWYEMVRRCCGRPVVVDSSKHARRLKLLYFADPQRFRLIHLVRDGRAVAASKMRRRGIGMKTAACEWASDNRRSLWAQRGIPAGQRLTIQYEALCRQPEGTMRNVCQFLDLPFEPNMLLLNKKTAHNIAGNPMRLRKDETCIELDEQWRGQLSAQDVRVFQRVAGRWNRRFGYTD